MFTGFETENTPAIKVWDFATANRSGIQIALTDDCAPIQVIVGGGSSNTINLYLPPSPIEGKQIKLVHALYGNTSCKINIFSSDVSGGGASFSMGSLDAGQTLDLCYSKNFIFRSTSPTKTGWISLNQASISASNQGAISLGIGNSASGQLSAAIGGVSNTASNTYAAVIGGSSNTASGSNAAVIGGSSNNATNNDSAVLGGNSNLCSGSSSVIVGGTYGSTRSIIGNLVLPASQNPIVSSYGLSQSATLVLGRETTGATATRLTSNNTSTGSTTNQVILPNNSAYTFQGTVIAAKTAAGDTSSWKFEGAIKRGANAASTVLVAAVTPTVIAQDVGAVTWGLAVTADTTNGGIAVTVTGAAATTIRWVCKIETTEVTF